MQLKEFIIKFKLDIIAFSSITLIYLAALSFFWGHMGHVIIDCGREAYILQELLNGQLLYKDILNGYGPFAYQVNAIFFNLFGENLNVLYAAGAINAFIILLTTYLISRNITSKRVSWIICLIIISTFIFNTTVSNYIFPYIYSVIYAVSGFLLSVLFCIYFIKYKRPVFIFFALLFYSISFISKYEFSLFMVLILIIILSGPRLTIKEIILYLSGLLLIPLISWLYLIIQGVSINDVLAILNLVSKYSHTDAFKSFYTYSIGFYPSIEMIISTLKSFFVVAILFLIPSLLIYFSFKYLEKLSSYLKIVLICLIMVILIIIDYYFSLMIPYSLYIMYFSWLPLSTAGLLIFMCYKSIIKCNNKNISSVNTSNKLLNFYHIIVAEFKNKDPGELIYIFLLFTAVLATIKGMFFVSIEVYAPYILILPLLVNIVFIVDYIPHFIKNLQKTVAQNAFILVLFLTALMFLFINTNDIKKNYTATIKTNRGYIHTFNHYGIPYNQTIKYIAEHISPTESFLMLPESALLNFLTNRSAGSRFINLKPSNIDIFGEENIIKELKSAPPDYIFINSTNFYDQFFGKEYAQKIFAFIKDNYDFKTSFGDQFKVYIFKYNKNSQNI